MIIDEARNPASEHPFKGDVDLAKLQKVIDEVGAEHIPYVCIATAVNMAGGQPISLGNLRKVRELTGKHGIRIIHDATRVAENAYFVKEREPGCADMSVSEIVRRTSIRTPSRRRRWPSRSTSTAACAPWSVAT